MGQRERVCIIKAAQRSVRVAFCSVGLFSQVCNNFLLRYVLDPLVHNSGQCPAEPLLLSPGPVTTIGPPWFDVIIRRQ